MPMISALRIDSLMTAAALPSRGIPVSGDARSRGPMPMLHMTHCRAPARLQHPPNEELGTSTLGGTPIRGCIRTPPAPGARRHGPKSCPSGEELTGTEEADPGGDDLRTSTAWSARTGGAR